MQEQTTIGMQAMHWIDPGVTRSWGGCGKGMGAVMMDAPPSRSATRRIRFDQPRRSDDQARTPRTRRTAGSIDASRHWNFKLYVNKALAGTAPEAVERNPTH
ncbi:MAG: hypothetical protein GY895_12865 [Phycisphaera sp.]|nr:hypothetical protein [Phycisphaera sp.]